jgi:methyl-accepting chemotaxis protein
MAFFCFDIPIFLRQKFTTDFTSVYDLSLFDNPCSVHMIIVEAVVQQYCHSVQTIRDKLRAVEKRRLGDSSRRDQEISNELQEIQKAIILSIENLTVAINTVRDMSTQHVEFLDERGSHLSSQAFMNSKNTTKSLKFQLQMLENLQTRNESLAARFRIQQDDQRAETMHALTRLNRDTLRMNYLSQNISRGYGSIFFLLLPGIFVSVRWKEGT